MAGHQGQTSGDVGNGKSGGLIVHARYPRPVITNRCPSLGDALLDLASQLSERSVATQTSCGTCGRCALIPPLHRRRLVPSQGSRGPTAAQAMAVAHKHLGCVKDRPRLIRQGSSEARHRVGTKCPPSGDARHSSANRSTTVQSADRGSSGRWSARPADAGSGSERLCWASSRRRPPYRVGGRSPARHLDHASHRRIPADSEAGGSRLGGVAGIDST